jgi:hypothetical protein
MSHPRAQVVFAQPDSDHAPEEFLGFSFPLCGRREARWRSYRGKLIISAVSFTVSGRLHGERFTTHYIVQCTKP